MLKVILASNSIRRKEILEMLKIDFSIIVADIDETINLSNDLVEEVKNLAYKKAYKIFSKYSDAIVIGADTVVVCEGQVLGKPDKNNYEKSAYEMLSLLSNKTHSVITGLAILSKDRIYRDASISSVTFDSLSTNEILSYIKTGESRDKAGAYAVQGIFSKFIKHIDGDYYAIMGLPLNLVYKEFKEHYQLGLD